MAADKCNDIPLLGMAKDRFFLQAKQGTKKSESLNIEKTLTKFKKAKFPKAEHAYEYVIVGDTIRYHDKNDGDADEGHTTLCNEREREQLEKGAQLVTYGGIFFTENGKVVKFSNLSGHFKPPMICGPVIGETWFPGANFDIVKFSVMKRNETGVSCQCYPGHFIKARTY